MTDSVLTDAQRELLGLFFSLPESEGFVLAGGAALVANGLTERPTRDIDLFGGGPGVEVAVAADALERSYVEQGWTVERTRDAPTFRRLVVRSGRGEVLVDLAIDAPPLSAPTITALGPTYPAEELAARKLLALFDRAEVRDFVDIVAISGHLDVDRLRDIARQIDAGFTDHLLAEMLATHRRFTDGEIAELGGSPDRVRAFADDWRARLLDRPDPPA